MKNFLLAAAAVAISIVSVSPAHAIPVTYNMTFDALLGPSGTGSFRYDSDAQTLTNLVWDFGSGIVGGFSLINPTIPGPTGHSAAANLFEMLTQIDTTPALCSNPIIPTTCTFSTTGNFGVTPGNVNRIAFSTGSLYGDSAFYSFAMGSLVQPPVGGVPSPPQVVGPSVANGYVRATLAVPEPSAIFLMSLGVLALGISRRRSVAR